MDQQNIDVDQKLYKYYLLRRIVLSLSLLSLFFLICYYSNGVSIFPYSLTYNLERKYMFLICNGILAFLAKTSSDSRRHYSPISDEFPGGVGQESSSPASLVADDIHDQRQVVRNEKVLESDETGLRSANGGENDDVFGGSGSPETAPEEAEAETEAEEEEETMSTEELNRKIEEFIRKMKEEIRVEAQQQLIAV